MSLPTLYEYYAPHVIASGLIAKKDGFYLNNKEITLHSGAMHYFRVPPGYWRDRLRKMRAAGLNAVETYVPWNLHEPQRDVFDFGDADNDFSGFLNIVKYIQLAREEDLFVIVRPGPYICAEWDFGGLPSWLLNEKDLKLRTSDPKYMKRVTDYFNQLLPLLTPLQFTKGGPIIAFQIENEYGSIMEDGTIPDLEYLKALKDLFVKNNLVELFFTSDTPSLHGSAGSLPGILQTANFKQEPEREFMLLKELQPDKPLMVMEYWTGWFDHWLEEYHNTEPPQVYCDVLERILKFPSSVNFYMFHGGTNFGFMNGANVFTDYQPDVTSYDYDAPLSEAGDYTEKYYKTIEILARYQKVKTRLPELPAETQKVAYPTMKVVAYLTYRDILNQISADAKVTLPDVVSMENLPINNGSGQSYGYVIYKKRVPLRKESSLKISGHIHDTAMVLVDGILKTKPLKSLDDISGFGYWSTENPELILKSESAGEHDLDIIVENWGRVNFGVLSDFDQRKGLRDGPVLLDDKALSNWEICALEINKKWVNSLSGWKQGNALEEKGPTFSKVILCITKAQDTFIDLTGWSKGIVFINGFNLGRYCHLGPPQTLYLPAPLLKIGENEIIIFEHFKPNSSLSFLDHPVLGPVKASAL
ncbi:beta-galactosidase-1-like protein 2 [Cephus cinctus]|uniref:Beta-galactosidase n=1 Tax=Cephus cinctus TaxID=211228 RepID=A0AAJ7FM42_CEPCN|nr:beta-galactosidase-1-like protein 2 [Cephus cinctus]XP_015598576.1 beta-galactosidase-1-like protein 2 [Cephus cinctus]XP_015598578.1 beta-galactosidase-1-like protein 2 [Cephus cinctus]XP_015598579.1 beta-galactosidase-1-like protein 2 [Cephus cinctus]XP_015598580.1 beta-galactosidase-1-like protein 2 [Cephus cinctus]XP_024942397.1 beta-galactosidase-1-like protein 2 [Cephus cinctus]